MKKTAAQRIADIRAAEKRVHEMRRLNARGLSMSQIGARYGISKQRVHAILRAAQ
jgi:DNA-directed RNA polymerase sigma subunit (sigma70/sigma32)